jgi:O-acetyl-ADP-ribose deacetylase (regulator of RNase III)
MTNLDALLSLLINENQGYNQLEISGTIAEKRKMLRMLMNTRPAIPLSEDIIQKQDIELHEQLEEKGIVQLHTLAACPTDKRLILWKGDITRLPVDAIVNAANSQLLGCFSPLHNCIDNAIHSAAGLQLRWECNKIMTEQGFPEPTGSAKITIGFNLPAKHIIHTVGPIIENNHLTAEDENLLASCYQSCLLLAHKNKLKSIAFCCISTGVFGFPNQRAAEIAVITVLSFFEENRDTSIQKVLFNVFKDLDYDLYHQLLYKSKNQ